MSFTIDENAQCLLLKKSVAWNGGNKDDGTIDSIKSHKSATDVTEVSLALTMATFESKMTTSFNQMREDAREDLKADQEADWAREERMDKRREVERDEEKRVQAEEQNKIQSMLRMFLPMMNNNNQ